MFLVMVSHLFLLRCLFICCLKRNCRIDFCFCDSLLFICGLCSVCTRFKICVCAILYVCHLVCCPVSISLAYREVSKTGTAKERKEKQKSNQSKREKKKKNRFFVLFGTLLWGDAPLSTPSPRWPQNPPLCIAYCSCCYDHISLPCLAEECSGVVSLKERRKKKKETGFPVTVASTSFAASR